MKKTVITCLATFTVISNIAFGQADTTYEYEPSKKHPFGLPHPEAPQQIKDFDPLIGECNCQSIARNPDQTWGDTLSMIWRFKYIMNGFGVQDETLKPDGVYAGSIRQYNIDSAKWYVHSYSSNSAPNTLPAWEGEKTGENTIRLYRPNKAPNGMDGFYRITFYDIGREGFNWLGEWVDTSEAIVFPLWKIFCKKRP